ncbi:metallopeptidase family protein [Jatrophihabitans endophyticus]|uniref:metallopeptidase family protein n=1 Tax=Jatrophihabitans endophyticus TaxID=1206085 RepID=UPI0026ECCA78|nr:metallopeptidase family protein [Jatrophihabitans endophyticus]
MRGAQGGNRQSRRGAAKAGPRAEGPAGATTATGSGRKPRRRDRRGRGVRGHLAPVGVPVHRTRSEVFDDLVLDAVDELEEHWAGELAALEFAVEDVPPEPDAIVLDAGTVVDRGVPLGRLFREGLPEIPQPVVVVYRRPIEARATDPDDRADLVFMVVVDLAAEFLGRDVDEIG